MNTPPAFARLDAAAAATAGFSSCAAAVAALEAAGVPFAPRRGRLVVVDARPVGLNADGSAVCRHRDVSVCPACLSADPAYVELLGATWYVTDPAERAELLALRAEISEAAP